MHFKKSTIWNILYVIVTCIWVFSMIKLLVGDDKTLGFIEAPRLNRSIEIMLNDKLEKTIVVFRAGILPLRDAEHRSFFTMDYIDEFRILTQINYAQSEKDPNDLGRVFLLPQETWIEKRNGNFRLTAYLEVDDSLTYDAAPYSKSSTVFVPRTVFKNIMERQGWFFLLDKDGNVLDRIDLRQFK